MTMVKILSCVVLFGSLAGLVALLAGWFSGRGKRAWVTAGCLVMLVCLSLAVLMADLVQDELVTDLLGLITQNTIRRTMPWMN